MTVHEETNIRIDFDKGMDITPIVVFEGVEQEDKSEIFNKKTHEIEEVISFIEGWETSCDVFI